MARQCGGCQIQCINYKEQLRFKKNKVYNNLVRIGGQSDFVMNDVMGMDEPFNYRNKSQFPVGMDKEGNIISGFLCRKNSFYYKYRQLQPWLKKLMAVM